MGMSIQTIVEGIGYAAGASKTGRCFRSGDLEVHLVERADEKLEVVVLERLASIHLEELEPTLKPDRSDDRYTTDLDVMGPAGQSNHVLECSCAACRRAYIAP